MNLRQHEHRDDMKVWLSENEIQQLLATVENQPNKRIAFMLGVRCGLRSEEVTKVRPLDVRESDAGPMLVIHSGKGDKYRETPVPRDLMTQIHTANQYRDKPDEYPIVTSQSDTEGVSTRTLRRWIQASREQLAAEHDERWNHLTFHDLRATWATQLRSADVDSMLVCDWGGWDDLETFLEAYKGTFTPEAQLRERQKVEWLQ